MFKNLSRFLVHVLIVCFALTLSSIPWDGYGTTICLAILPIEGHLVVSKFFDYIK